MSVARCEEINRRLRAAGVPVVEHPGWQSRGNGQSPAYEGGIVHHTATGYANSVLGVLVYGRSDLSGPLCNYTGFADGRIAVVAAYPANHAGASGGRSMGPLPVTSSFNRRVLGLEIAYPGDQPMTAAQYRSACIWARIVAQVVGSGNIQRIRAHAETSITGKWDPGYAPGRTIDMAKFRRDAANGLEDDMPLTQSDIDKIAQRVWSWNVGNPTVWNGKGDKPNEQAYVALSYMESRIRNALKGVSGGGSTVDLSELLAVVKDIQSKITPNPAWQHEKYNVANGLNQAIHEQRQLGKALAPGTIADPT